MKVCSNIQNIRAVTCAWFNQGITGDVTNALPDKKQHQDAARSVRDGKPLFREWSGLSFQWPAGTPIFMDLEPLWSGPMDLDEKVFWHTEVAQWYLDIAPGCKLFSYTGTAPADFLNTGTADSYREFAEVAWPFLKRLSAITWGTYFGQSDALAYWFKQCRLALVRMSAALDGRKPVQFLTKGTFASEWTPRLDGETDEAYMARLCTFRTQHGEVRRQLRNYVDSWFVWSEPGAPYEAEAGHLIEALAG